MSLPTLFAGKSAPGLSAALDLRFALDKSLTAYRGPTPSFSRASTGSYFDGSGVLRYANVNTILYSEQLENAYWFKSGLSISADSTVAPDGKTTADKVVENASSGIKYGTIAGGFSVVSGTTYTFSAYAKDSGRYFGFATNSTAFPNAIGAVFNLTNGTISNIQANTTASIQSVGNGWYRCIITGTANSSTTTNINFGISNDLNQIYPSYTGNGSSGYFLWGFQMETGSTVGTYCPTTSSANSAPRFDHTFNGTSWVSRGLLVEEQRTNSLQYSESFNTSPYWAAAGGATITANQAVAPDGNTTADNVAGVNGFYQNSAGMGSSTATNTASIFAKANGSSSITLRINEWGSGINYVEGTFNLSNGTATATNGGSGSGATASMIDCGNGWYRCIITGKPSTTAGTCGFYPYGMTTSVYCWGAQFEAGASFATSYIPSLSNSSTTRSADVCQITGSDFSGFWNGTEGSVAVEFDQLADATKMTNESYIYGFQNAADTEQFILRGQSNGVYYWRSVNSGNIEATAQIASLGAATVKHAAGYKVNDFASTFNGAAVISDTSGATPNPTSLGIGFYLPTSSNRINGHIARLRYYRKRLSNETLQLLSEPDPTLNLQFALNKTLTPVAGPAPSFSRASTGTFFNASGVLTSASINTPRFDHVFSGGQWVSRGLLVEEQRTNGLLQSNNFGTSPWFVGASRGFLTQNAASPDGAINAWTATCTVTSAGGFYLNQLGISSPSGNYTFSMFAKKGNNGFAGVQAYDSVSGHYATVYFDLTNGLSGNVVSSGYTNISHGITNCGNGWYRCFLTFNKGNSNALDIYPILTADSMGAFAGTSGQTNLFYGMQLESGAFPTSYIPTTSSSVTRSADVCQITGTSFNWMWNQGEGSVAVEYDQWKPLNIGTLVSFNDGGTSNVLYDYVSEGTSGGIDYGPSFYIRSGGTWTVQFNNSPIVSGQQKYAVAFKTNDAAMSYIGGAVQTDATVTLPTVNQMGIGKPLFAQYPFSGHIAKLIYYPARLTNTKLQQLST